MAETGELRSKMEKVQLDMIDMVSKYPRPIEISGRWKIICVTADDELQVEMRLLQQSTTFLDWWKDMEIANETQLINQENKFVIKNISRQTFERVIEWMKTHIGTSDPIIREDSFTHERIHFELTPEEKSFFNIRPDQLAELLEAAKFLDLKFLYLYGCQQMFNWMIGMVDSGRGEQLRTMMQMEPLTDEELKKVEEKNKWCNL